jgi:DNA-binding transcriptional regulator YdaS (Cro superfamily)
MRTQQAIEHFGSPSAIAAALGISRPAVSKWGDTVPYASARRLEQLSGGALALDESLYDVHLRPLRPATESRAS